MGVILFRLAMARRSLRLARLRRAAKYPNKIRQAKQIVPFFIACFGVIGSTATPRNKTVVSMPLFVRFERRVSQPPLLHLSREVFVPARRTDMKIRFAALVDPPRIIHDTANAARKPLRRPPSPVIAENLLGFLDKPSAHPVLLHIVPFQFVQIYDKHIVIQNIRSGTQISGSETVPRLHESFFISIFVGCTIYMHNICTAQDS